MREMKREDRDFVWPMAFLFVFLAIVAICMTVYQIAALKSNCPAEAIEMTRQSDVEHDT